MAPGREEGLVVQRDAQHRQLQPRDLSRHLRRHARVREDLVEQAADDVDHHVVELAGRGLQQFLAVCADQVDRHQPGQAFVVLRAAAGGQIDRAAAAEAGNAALRAAPLHAERVAVVTGGAARHCVERARAARDRGQPAQQRHQLRVGLPGLAFARRATLPRGPGRGVPRWPTLRRPARDVACASRSMRLPGPTTPTRSPGRLRPEWRESQTLVARIDAMQLIARAVDGAHRQPDRPHAALLQAAQDLAVAGRHRLRHHLAHVARQQLAAVGVVGHRFDRAVQRRAEHIGAQRVALLVGAAGPHHRAHVGGEIAQLPFAFVRDHLAEAVVVHPLLDLAVVDQAERLPVGRWQAGAASCCAAPVPGSPSRAARHGRSSGTRPCCAAGRAGSRSAGRARGCARPTAPRPRGCRTRAGRPTLRSS